jgi:tetratricopeptide (TPR) repeat protein
VVFDDIQWGEQTFLDLIEHVALLSSGAAILLLCLARPELAEDRSGWPITIRLEHLGEAEVERLIPNRIGAGLRRRIARAAGGNPLFIEEMLAMAEQSDAQVTVPPTLQALLAARLDRLEAPERSTLERAAVEGEVFHRGAVQALGAGDQVIRYLAALVRKELIIPAATQIPDEEAFRFRHLLIRDAAYNALPKAVRADLHERFAGWLDERGARVVEMDEIVGYHLERACRYRSELGISVDEGVVTAARRRLTDAGERALVRQDEGTAVSLLERAASLVPEGQLDLGLEVELAVALSATGRNPEALGRARSIAERAVAAGDRIGELCGRLLEGSSRTFIEPEGATEQLEALLDDALPVLEGSGDDLALFVGNYALGRIAIMRLQFDAGIEVYDRAAEHARRARLPHHFLGQRALLRLKGTTPLPDVLAWLEEQGSQGSQPLVLKSYRADALARLGREAEARAMVSDLLSELADRGAEAGERVMAMGFQCLDVELLVGDADAAVRLGEEACAALEAEDERSVLSTVAGKLAQALYELGRLEEADAWAGRAAELGASDDAMTQFLWRQARAKVLARWGQHAEAQRLGHEAIAIAEDTEALEFQADAYADLAEVLSLAGRLPQAVEALGEALERYERKGDIVMAQRTRERLAPIGDGEGADRSI